MQTFRVWAPLPKKLEIEIGQVRFPMTRNADGWWTAVIPPPDPGTDYGFMLDGEGPFPDPRSPWQPNGIHGHSRLIDHSNFRWTDGHWQAPNLSQAVIYELHMGTFTPEGTFDAAISKLDHLIGLGITHVELMPVNGFSGAHGWGYDGVDLYAPHHAYGGPEGLKRLVDACHARGLAVLLDVVYNHLGPAGNYLAKFGPYFTPRHVSPWGEAINFDGAHCAEVRRFFCDNALMWLRDYHIDGLRLDAVHAIIDTAAVPFLEQLAIEVKQLGGRLNRRFVLIAESDLNDPRLIWPRERGGFALDAQWSDDFHHALHAALTDEKDGYYADFGTLADLAKALQRGFVYDGAYSVFRHRPHGRPPVGLDGNHFLGYLQNHDQVGNRAQGERSGKLMSAGRLKIGAALVLTSPFIPMLFQGEEWGAASPFQYFTNHQDAKLGDMVREGRRKEFEAFAWKKEEIPDPQARETFERSKLEWSELSEPQHTDLLDWYRRLIALRQAESSLRDGRMDRVQPWFSESQRWLVVERKPFLIACNLATHAQPVPLPPGNRRVLISSVRAGKLHDASVVLPPDSVAIVRLD